MDNPAQTSTNLQECFSYKNHLQQYTQRSSMPLPTYHTVMEVLQPPSFMSTVWVDGSPYTSSKSFPNRKDAEKDAARVAYDGVAKRTKDEVATLIRKNSAFCKSILNEYAAKMNIEIPTYRTFQSVGKDPVFVSALVFNGVTYTGEAGRSKKEAEQLGALAAILSILGNSESAGNSASGTVISVIIKSKFRLFASDTHNGATPVATETGPRLDMGKEKEVEVTGETNNVPVTAISKICSGQLASIPTTQTNNEPITAISEICSGQLACIPAAHQPCNDSKRPKLEPSSSTIAPVMVSAPPVSEQPPAVGSSSARKRNRKKKKAKNTVQADAQLPFALFPIAQVPPCSVAQ